MKMLKEQNSRASQKANSHDCFHELNLKNLCKLSDLQNLNFSFVGLFHDLSNLLGIILMNAQELKKSLNNPKLLKRNHLILNCIINSAEKLCELLKRAHELINKNKQAALFSIPKIIKLSFEALKYELHKEQIKVVLNLGNKCLYYGDKHKFEQVITNLIINAIDALRATSIKNKQISCQCKKTSKNVIIKVEDNGPGIQARDIDRIFQIFFSTKKCRGLGIGLTIIKNTIEKEFKGSIEVKSQPGIKTIFIIKIPIKK